MAEFTYYSMLAVGRVESAEVILSPFISKL